jgi:hypothetical protein
MSAEAVADPADSSIDAAANAFDAYQSALSTAIVEEVNALENRTWTAGMNAYFQDMSYDYLKKSCGLKMDAFRVSDNRTRAHSRIQERCAGFVSYARARVLMLTYECSHTNRAPRLDSSL